MLRRSRTRRKPLLSAVLVAGVGVCSFATGQAQAVTAPTTPSTTAHQAATVAGDLPANWTLDADGSRLVWNSPKPLPVLDQKIDITADGETIPGAVVSEDGRSVSVEAGNLDIENPATLKVVAGERRLDTTAEQPAAERTPTPTASPDPKATTDLPSWDPGKRGTFKTTKGEYRLDDLKIKEYPAPVEMQAQVVVPVGATDKRPVALFLHGRHAACYSASAPEDSDGYMSWPCPKGWKPIPSYQGYTQTQDLLASQGWITLSISADGINAQDQVADGGANSRSELVRAHLQQWADWSASDSSWASAPSAVRAGPRPDLSRVMLVGHSRGGEGVNHAALDSSVDESLPWHIRAQVLIAPTAFSRNPAPGVATVVLLPACDGDVSDLQGQYYLDSARDITTDPVLRSAVYVEGANHNFFNSEWTPGLAQAPADDDWWTDSHDPTTQCGSKAVPRLRPVQQRTVGAVYTAAAAQALVLGQSKPLALLDGSAVRPQSTSPARIYSHALGGNRTRLLIPTGSTSVVSGSGTVGSRCLTSRDAEDPSSCSRTHHASNTPSFGALLGMKDEPTRTVVTVDWKKASGAAAVAVSSSTVPDDATDLTLRIAVPPTARGTQFEVRLTDTAGHKATLATKTMNGLPSTAGADSQMSSFWAQEVRLPLDRAALKKAGIDLRHISRLQFLPRSRTGSLALLDAWSYRAGLATSAPATLPVFDVQTVTVDEGSVDRTVNLPIAIRGTVRTQATAYIIVSNKSGGFSSTKVTVAPGSTGFTVPVKIKGNTLDSSDTVSYAVVGMGTSQIVASTMEGSVNVKDDDASPPLSYTSTATTTEGGTLQWTFTRKNTSELPLFIPATFKAPTDGTKELTVGDLNAAWVKDQGYTGSLNVPLSRSEITLFVETAPGATKAVLSLPTRKDKVKEGTEGVTLRIPGQKEMGPDEEPIPGLPQGATLVGTVKNAA